MALKLVIGNKNYSSWSLRGWLFLQESGLQFEEIRLPLGTEQWQQEIGRYSPARQVPVLIDGEITVWDTQAIFAYVRERHPAAVGWPESGVARALAQSIAAEMHAGFLGVRQQLPQNIRARHPLALGDLAPATRGEIERIQAIWADCKQRFGQTGPWLFGEFTLADVMYAPVALRFLTYAIPVRPEAAFFMEAVQSLESIQAWAAAAAIEPEVLEYIDRLAPPA